MHITFLNGTEQEQNLFRDAVEEFTEDTPIPVPGFPMRAPNYYIQESFYFIYTVPVPVTVEFASTEELDDDFATTTTSDFTIPAIYEPAVDWPASNLPEDPLTPVFKQCFVKVRDQLIDQIGEKGFKDVVRHEMAHVAMAWLPESSIVALCEMFGGTRDQWRSGNWGRHIEEATAESFKDYFTYLNDGGALAGTEARVWRPNRTEWHLPEAKVDDFQDIFNTSLNVGLGTVPEDITGGVYGAPGAIGYHWIESTDHQNPGLIEIEPDRAITFLNPLITPPETEPHAWQVIQHIDMHFSASFAIPYLFGQCGVFAQLVDYPVGVYAPIDGTEEIAQFLVVTDGVDRDVSGHLGNLESHVLGDSLTSQPYGENADYLNFEGPYYLEDFGATLLAHFDYTHSYSQLFVYPGPDPPATDEELGSMIPERLDFRVGFGGGGLGRTNWFPPPDGNIKASDGPSGRRPRKAIAGRVGPKAAVFA